MDAVADYDPFSPEVQADPYPYYRRLRDHAPVHHNPRRDLWSLSRYEDVRRASLDWHTFSTQDGTDPDFVGKVLGLNGFLDIDPPRHDELRKLVFDAFSPAAIATLEPTIRAQAAALLDGIVAKGSADLGLEFACVLPLTVVSGYIGVPRDDLRHLTRLVFRCYEPSPFELTGAVQDAAGELRGYFTDLLAERAAHPTGDVLTRLGEAHHRAGTATLDEVLDTALLLFIAGYMTTAGLLTAAFFLLAHHPEERALLAKEPDRLPRAVEEFLRIEPPVQLLCRTATRDVALHGTTIPAGGRVALLYGSANHDERQFPDPERLDLDRADNRHLAFGEGIHRCLGMTLARLEGRIALELALERLPDYEVAGPIRRVASPVSREIVSLPVAFEGAPPAPPAS